jgi:hypothetical protein
MRVRRILSSEGARTAGGSGGPSRSAPPRGRRRRPPPLQALAVNPVDAVDRPAVPQVEVRC